MVESVMWSESPSTAIYYGYLVIGRTVPGGTETDYQTGYTSHEDPDVRAMCPDGWEVLESTTRQLRPRSDVYDAVAFDTMVQHYVIALLWTEYDNRPEEPTNLDADWEPDDVSEEAMASIREDCAGFVDLAGEDLRGMDPEQAGHDFLLTRNGHGVGFWDRGLGERGDRLTKWAHSYGETTAYVGSGVIEVED